MWVEVDVSVDGVINVLTDVLINMLSVTIVAVGMGFVDVEIVLVTPALTVLEPGMLSCAMEVMSDGWVEAVTDMDVSLDRRVGKLIGALARV